MNSSQKPLFFDGAFGTYYHQISNRCDCCELANLEDRAVVLQIHREYIASGVNAIKTNTFGANSQLADPDIVASVIQNGYAIALEAVRDTTVEIFADIGYIHADQEDVSEEYMRLSQIFLDCGAKNFIFETFGEYEVLKPSIRMIKSKQPDACILVSFAVSQDGYTPKGHYYKTLISVASQNPDISIVGLNCICGPSHLYHLMKELDLHSLCFSAMPNAGYPSTVNGRTVYRDNAEYFSQKLADIHALGVNTLGGCCGTTPAHISQAIRRISNAAPVAFPIITPKRDKNTQTGKGNCFLPKLGQKKKIIAIELDPPINADTDYIIDAAKKASQAGADIITVADSPLARARADSIMLAAKIKREAQIDVIPHLSCRDRNNISIKSVLLGASIEEIHNIFAVTGDPVSPTNRGDCTGVFDFNSFGLISFIKNLNADSIKAPFGVGAALNVNATRFENELARAKKKLDCGADFFMTQPIFSNQAIDNLIKTKKQLGCKILAGILPFASYKNALFLNNEVFGIHIPDHILQSLIDKDPAEVTEMSINFSFNIIKNAYDSCDGFYFMPPLRRIDLVCRLAQEVRRLEKI